MKYWYLLLVAAAGLAAGPAAAQIEVACRPQFAQYLPREPLRVEVTIVNSTANPLVLSGADANVLLSFEIARGQPASQLPLKNEARPEWAIAPGATATRGFDLLDNFEIAQPGPHTLRAVLTWRERQYRSTESYFDIVPGYEIFSTMQAGGPDDRVQTLRLVTLHRDKGEFLFLEIMDDASGYCMGLVGLGRIIRVYKPLIRADADGEIHVLHQSGPAQFTHTIVGPDGSLSDSESFFGTGDRIALKTQADGTVEVVGRWR